MVKRKIFELYYLHSMEKRSLRYILSTFVGSSALAKVRGKVG